jgi:hypothetical protein
VNLDTSLVMAKKKGIELTALLAIGTEYVHSCKSNYYTTIAMEAPLILTNVLLIGPKPSKFLFRNN